MEDLPSVWDLRKPGSALLTTGGKTVKQVSPITCGRMGGHWKSTEAQQFYVQIATDFG